VKRAARLRKSRENFKYTLLARDGRCMICGRYLDERTVNPHHITTKGAGGDDNLENGISLCHQHHVDTHNGHYSPATLRWILKLVYGYDWEPGDEGREQAEQIWRDIHCATQVPLW